MYLKKNRLLATTMAGTIALTMTACGSQSQEAGAEKSGQLTYTSYGSAYQDAQFQSWLDPFAAAEGINIVQDQPTDYTKIKAMVESGKVTWDLVDTEPHFSIANCDKYLEKIDLTGIDAGDFPEGSISECGAPSSLYSLAMTYNTEKYGSNTPTSLKDFFDTSRFPGKRLIPSWAAGGALEAALLADGVSAEQLYPLDYDRAFQKLDTIKKDLVFWDTAAQSQTSLESQSVGMGLVWSGRIHEARKNGAPYAPMWNQNLLEYATFVIPKGSPNKELAEAAIRYIMQPENQSRFAESIPYGPANLSATPNLEGEAAEFNVSRPEIREQGVWMDFRWWAENEAAASKRWMEWSLG